MREYPLELADIVTVRSSIMRKLANAAKRPWKPVLTSLRYDIGFRGRLIRKLAEWQPDIVFVDFTQMAGYISDIRKVCPHALTVLYEHDVSTQMARRRAQHSTGLQRAFWSREAQLLSRDEVRLCNHYDLVCAPTEKDVSLLTALGVDHGRAHRICSFRLGTDDLGLWQDPGSSSTPCLLFVGAMSRQENIDAVRRLIERILPRLAESLPDIRVKIVGGGKHSLKTEFGGNPRVEFTGFVPSILESAQECHVAVFPLTLGAGVKIKVLEAMSWGMPVVTTTVGAEGINAQDQVHMCIADEDEALVTRIKHLLLDPERRTLIGKAGRDLCSEQFNFGKEMNRLVSLLNGALVKDMR